MAVLAATAVLLGAWSLAPGSEDHWVDANLVLASLQHAGIGAIVALLHLGSGAGLLSIIARDKGWSAFELILFGFPLGLPLWVGAAVLSGLGLIGTVAGLGALLILSAVAVVRFGPSILRPALGLAALAILYGAWMGLIQHGPTDTLTAWPIMDLLHYATNIAALNKGGWPPPDLNYAGESSAVFNLLWSGIGASLLDLVVIDPFLFIVAGGQAAFLIFTGAALVCAVKALGIESVRVRALLGLAVMTGVYFPGWITNSPPVLYVNALTLAFAAALLRVEGRLRAGDFQWGGIGALAGLSIAGPALTKVTLFGLFAPFAGLAVLSNWRSLPTAVRLGSLALMALGLAGSLGIVILYWDDMAGFLRPQSWSWVWYSNGYSGLLPILMREISALIVGVAIIWLRPGLASFGLLALMAITLFFPALLIVVTCAAGLFAVIYWHDGLARRKGPAALLALAFLLAVPKAVFGDPAGMTAAVGWILGVGTMVSLCLCADRGVRSLGRTALSALALGSLLGAAALQKIPFRSGFWYPTAGYEGLTPDHLDIWRTVEECLPDTALVFTDGDGEAATLQDYWNLYPQSSGRHVYIAGTGQSFGPLRAPDRIEARRRTNRAVLSGQVPPDAVDPAGRYGPYARVAATPPPDGWAEVYRNPRFSLSIWGDAGVGSGCGAADTFTRR